MSTPHLDLTKSLRSIEKGIVKSSPQILIGVGIVGMVGAIVMAVKATPKAMQACDEYEPEADDIVKEVIDGEWDNGEQRRILLTEAGYNYEVVEAAVNDYLSRPEITPMERVKVCWKYYIPSAVAALGSAACIIAANSINSKRYAALMAAYTLSETAFKEYKEEVIDTVGNKKEQEVRENIAQKHVDEKPISKAEVYTTNKGGTLCFDAISGRYFYSDKQTIEDSINHMNARLLTEMFLCLNDLYFDLGLDPIGMGFELGWNIDHGLIEPSLSTQLAEDGRPCLVLDYLIQPTCYGA